MDAIVDPECSLCTVHGSLGRDALLVLRLCHRVIGMRRILMSAILWYTYLYML